MMMAAADFISRLTEWLASLLWFLGTIASSLLRPPRVAPAPAPGPPDLISALPDCVLGSIVSLLPPKAGARTAVLSRRWRHVWQSVPLDLDMDARDTDLLHVTAQDICGVLSSRRGPIRSFSATLLGGQAKQDYDMCVQALARTHVHDTLVLRFPFWWRVPTYFPPVPLRRLALHSLRRLQLHVCRLDVDGDAVLSLPRLRSLHLSNVQVSEAALHRLLHGCTALRDLTLFAIHGLRRLVLRSTTLTDLCIMPHVPMDELSFHDAPNLESIDFMHMNLWAKPAIAQAAAAHPNLRQVTLRMPLLHRYTAASIHKARALSMVTVLELNMKFALGDAAELMKAALVLSLFPCLHSLQIWCLYKLGSSEADVRVEQWQQPEAEISCLNTKLKKVQMHEFIGTKGELEFARFLVAKAKRLEAMEVFHLFDWSNKDIDLVRKRICTSGKVSSGAQIYFSQSNSDFHMIEMEAYMEKIFLV